MYDNDIMYDIDTSMASWKILIDNKSASSNALAAFLR